MFLYVLHLFDVPRYELYGQFNDFTVLEYDEKLLRLCQPSWDNTVHPLTHNLVLFEFELYLYFKALVSFHYTNEKFVSVSYTKRSSQDQKWLKNK